MCPTFDPDTFMQQTIDAPLETEFRMVPEGEFQAMIGDFTSEAFSQIDFQYSKGERAGQPGTMTKFDCPFVINDSRLTQELGRENATVGCQLILDIANDGGLDFGPNKNVRLGQIRNAVGQNSPGPWQISHLRGAGPVMVRVVHKSGKRKDGSDWKRAEVDRVVPIR